MAEPLNATFFAFRKREKSGVLMRAALGFVIAMIVLSIGFFAAFATQFMPLVTWYGGMLNAAVTQNTASMETLGFPPNLGAFILGMFVWVFAIFLLLAAFEAACLRWMIRGESGGGLLGLTFGADTWRVYSSYWIWFLLYTAFSMVVGIAFAVLVGVAVGSMMASNGTVEQGANVSSLVVLPLIYLVQYGLMAYFGVRLAPATAASIARRRFAFFDAWKVTRGRFWPLFGSFFILFLIYAVALMVFYGIMFATVLTSMMPTLMQMGGDPKNIAGAEAQALQAYVQALTTPQNWVVIGVLYVVMSLVGVVFYVACYGINARAALAALEEGKIAAPAAS